MICCLNSDCHNPSCPDDTKFCFNCGTQLVELRRYRPIKQLGSGGFGKTYLAEDIERFNQPCVIKQFAPQSQGTSALEIATRLFEEEARRLQHLGEHSQIPALLAYFKQDNRLYLVQQYIKGANLLDEVEFLGVFSEQQIRELLLDLLNVLKWVHQEKVIHRDIKPENIIRRPTDNKLVLIDFGASKHLSGTIVAIRGTSIGTHGYVPMEQMGGGEAYPASDLYSLGATCFHLLSGVNPWELWKRQGYGWVNNWRQHLGQSVSQELGCVLDNLLQEDYQQRYQSAEAVLQDLNGQSSAPSASVTPPLSVQHNVNQNPLLLTLSGHSGSVSSVAISPDGETLVSGSRDKTIKIWHLRTGELKTTLTGHFFGVNSLAMSPDGETLVSGSGNETIKIWHLKTGELKTTLTGHSRSVFSVAISPDGETLVSGSDDETIKIWHLKTGELKTTLTGHSNLVKAVAVSPDGQTLVSGSDDNTIKIWRMPTYSVRPPILNRQSSPPSPSVRVPQPYRYQYQPPQQKANQNPLLLTLHEHSNFVTSLAISPDGETFVSGSWDNTIKIWQLKTGQLKTTLTGHILRVKSLAISPDGETLVSGTDNGTIKIWYLKTGQLKTTLTGHSNSVRSVAISPDGETLVSGSTDKTIKIWHLKTGQLKTTLTGHSSFVPSVAISPDGETFVSGSWDRTIKIWHLKTGELKTTLTGHSRWVEPVAISPDGETLVSGSYDNTIKIWQMPTYSVRPPILNRQSSPPSPSVRPPQPYQYQHQPSQQKANQNPLLLTLSGHSGWVYSVAISPDGETLVSGSSDKTIKIWHLKTGQLKTHLAGHSELVGSVAISPDGETLVSGSRDNTIKIWHLKTGQLKTTLTGHSSWVNSVAISPDGETLASGSWDNTNKIWNLKTGELKTTFPSLLSLFMLGFNGHSYCVISVAISPDGETLVSGSSDNTIKLWHLKTGQLKTNLTGHSGWVFSVAISPDGQTLVSGSADNTIKIWHLKTGELKTTLTGHHSPVISVAISPDGETLVSGGYDNTIKIWQMPK